MRVALFAILLVACRPAQTSSETKTAECPPTFAAAKVSATCEAEASCPFAEGTCSCTTGSYCGGTPPSEKIERENARLRWVCEKKPPAVREDGCPGVAPTGPCSESKECRYSDGCCSFEVSCVDGAWKRGDHQCPP